ncbi:hypothetical protein KIPB_011422, partial [Kipferlia bialata]
VVCGDHGCYTVSGGVWLPIGAGSRCAIDVTGGDRGRKVKIGRSRGRDTGPTHTQLTSVEDVRRLASTPADSGVKVIGVLISSTLARTRVEGWSFYQCTIANLSGSTLINCTFKECNLSGCDLHCTTLLDCAFTQCDLSNVNATTGAALVNVAFTDCNQTGMRLTVCTISGANTGLPTIDKTNHTLTATDLADVDVSIWDVTGSVLTGCDLTFIAGLTVGHISSLTSIKECGLTKMSLPGLDLSGTDATGSDVSGADLTGCIVTDANLTDCDLSSTNLTGVRGLTLEQLLSVESVEGATIGGVDMQGWDLRRVNLRDTDLSGCHMGGATVTETLVVGAYLPTADDAPTVEVDTARFVVGLGVTEDEVTVGDVGNTHPKNDNYNTITLIVPPVLEQGKWTLYAETGCNLYKSDFSARAQSYESGLQAYISVTRSGSNITVMGNRGRCEYQCTPGREARVELSLQKYMGTSILLCQE